MSEALRSEAKPRDIEQSACAPSSFAKTEPPSSAALATPSGTHSNTWTRVRHARHCLHDHGGYFQMILTAYSCLVVLWMAFFAMPKAPLSPSFSFGMS